MDTAFEDWLKTRPASVQRLAREFPIGSHFIDKGRTWYLIGYTEDDMLLVSETDPNKDYDGAYESRQRMCADHARPCRN